MVAIEGSVQFNWTRATTTCIGRHLSDGTTRIVFKSANGVPEIESPIFNYLSEHFFLKTSDPGQVSARVSGRGD